jgi:sterol desaturase/sphingolipid hydroxylase (fatty acid hydroxylase superfamily)
MFAFFIHVVCYDLWYYMIHMYLHNIQLYKYHKYHHFTRHTELTYSDAFDGHIIEYPLQTVGIVIPSIIITYDLPSILAAYLFVTIRTYLYHDHRCVWLVGNHHLLHHKHPKYNFGERWIDATFGTLYISGTEDDSQ